MSDLFDRASDLEQLQREEALARHRRPAAGPSYSHCEDCGDDIPAIRRQAVPGCTRCIVCQEVQERSGR